MSILRPQNKMKRRHAKWLVVGACLLALAGFAFANVVAIRDEGFVPPSKLHFDPAFAVRLSLIERKGGADIVVFGNSRVRSGVAPAELAASLGAPDRAVSLTAPGGFPAFYEMAYARAAAAERPPQLVVLGLSPRDLDDFDPRRNDTALAWRGSPGGALAGLPYIAPYARFEAFAADLIAAAFPALTERGRVLAALVPARVLAWQAGGEGGPVATLVRRWMRRLAGEAPGAWPEDWVRVSARIASYPGRFAALGSWHPDPATFGLDTAGGELPSAETQAQRATRIARVRQIQTEAAKRADAADCRRFDMRGTDAARLLDRLAADGVAVAIVQPPALALEPCETKANSSGAFAAALARLVQGRANVVAVVDLAGEAGGAFQRPELFGDGDHMIAAGARLVGAHIGAEIAAACPGVLQTFDCNSNRRR
jgi:hypothetical protein